MKKTTFRVKKIDCSSCALVMEGVCEDTAGVTKAEVNPHKKTLTVEHEDKFDTEQLAKILEKEGYPVEVTK
ncbi:MAG: cation transporter [Candidatus Kerfeldbacteria bacterium]